MRKYRLFGKIPVFDVVLVVVLLVFAFFAYKVLAGSKTATTYFESETKDIVLTVKFRNHSSALKSDVKAGETVIDSITNTVLGKSLSYKEEPYVIYDSDSIDGKTVATTCEDRKNIILQFSAKANMSDSGTDISGIKIGIGKTLSLSMPSLCSSGVITNIEVVG